MRFNSNKWQDLNTDLAHLRQPNVLVRADDIEYEAIILESDQYQATNHYRDVLYTHTDGTKYLLRLVPYVHPEGAADLVLGTLAYDANNVATFTPECEGEFISEAGVLTAATDVNRLVAGMLFGDYFTYLEDNASRLEMHRVVSIKEGDFLWVVREGIVFAYGTAACTINRMAVPGAAGQVTMTPDYDITTVTTLQATTLRNVPGLDNHFCLGRFLETTGGAGLVKMKLELSKRLHR